MPYLGLLFNALVWGVSWWPLRQLQNLGLHPVWATMCFFAIGVLILLATRPQALRLVLQQPMLWALAMAAATPTNRTRPAALPRWAPRSSS